jgi:hypothetical protein
MTRETLKGVDSQMGFIRALFRDIRDYSTAMNAEAQKHQILIVSGAVVAVVVLCTVFVLLGLTLFAITAFVLYCMFAVTYSFQLTGRKRLFFEEFRSSSDLGMYGMMLVAGVIFPVLIYIYCTNLLKNRRS